MPDFDLSTPAGLSHLPSIYVAQYIEDGPNVHLADNPRRTFPATPSLVESLNIISSLFPKDPETGTRQNLPDPEYDQIIVWHILKSGYRKEVWTFLGTQVSTYAGNTSQGTLPGDTETLFQQAYAAQW